MAYQRYVVSIALMLSSFLFRHPTISGRAGVRVLETPYVMGFVRPGGEITPIRDEEMHLMQRIVGEIRNVSAEPASFVPGDRVEIISGNLTGLQGTLHAKRGKHEFVVVLDSLGYQLRMSVETDALRKIHSGLRAGA